MLVSLFNQEEELEWLVNSLYKRHDMAVRIMGPLNGEFHIFVGDRDATIPYDTLMQESDARPHPFPTSHVVDRLWTLLLYTEKTLGLKHEYRPTRALIEFLEDLHGRST